MLVGDYALTTMSAQAFEFSRRMDKFFISLAKGSIVCAIFLAVVAILNFIAIYKLKPETTSILTYVLTWLVVASSIAGTFLLFRAAKPLRLITTTEGKDLVHLEAALVAYRTAYYSLAASLGFYSIRFLHFIVLDNKFFTN
jgi:hypothetical protein